MSAAALRKRRPPEGVHQNDGRLRILGLDCVGGAIDNARSRADIELWTLRTTARVSQRTHGCMLIAGGLLFVVAIRAAGTLVRGH